MEFEINERITLVRKTLKLSQTSFGEALGVSRDVINNIDNLRVPAKPLLIQQICRVYKVDPDWLETGEGEMFRPQDDMTALMDFAVEMFHDKDLDWIRRLCEYINALSPEERADVSRYVKGAAGAILSGTEEKEQEN